MKPTLFTEEGMSSQPADVTTAPPWREAWSRALEDPALRDLPYRVETNEHGQLVLSPHKPLHGVQQMSIGVLLRGLAAGSELPPGKVAAEFAVETRYGVKAPDVAWISAERWAQVPRDAEASPVMPELVIEVLSKANARAEIEEKRRLYFEGGCLEFWTCGADGRMTFYGPDGQLPASALVPAFPTVVE